MSVIEGVRFNPQRA